MSVTACLVNSAEIQMQNFRSDITEHAPAFAQLLDKSDAGVQPDTLEVLAAISQMVAWLTDDANIDTYSEYLRNLLRPGACTSC